MILPDRRDVRLRLSAVIVTVQVLGQTVLGFKVSVAQILVSVGLCALMEVAVAAWRQRAPSGPRARSVTLARFDTM